MMACWLRLPAIITIIVNIVTMIKLMTIIVMIMVIIRDLSWINLFSSHLYGSTGISERQ